MFSCTSNEDTRDGFTLNGDLRNLDAEWVYIQAKNDGEWEKVDSSKVDDGKFVLNGKVETPQMHYLQFGRSRKYVAVFVENSAISVSGDMDSIDLVTIAGSNIHDKYTKYSEGLKPFRDSMKELYPKYDLADSLGDEQMKNEIDSIYESVYAEQVDYTKVIIDENKNNALGPYLVSNIYYSDDKLEELEAIMKTFSEQALASIYYLELVTKIDIWKSVAVGQPAINFSQQDTTGTEISLSSFKGKYLLIDFWASWCGPCRVENPNVVALYQEMKDKDFEIIGVSFDTDREKWVNAIKEDGVNWIHVSDLKGWKNAVGATYGVNAIPHTVLLDKEGVIIAKNLRGKDLREKLESILY